MSSLPLPLEPEEMVARLPARLACIWLAGYQLAGNPPQPGRIGAAAAAAALGAAYGLERAWELCGITPERLEQLAGGQAAATPVERRRLHVAYRRYRLRPARIPLLR